MNAMANCKNIVLTDLGRRPWLTPPVRPRPGAEEPTETVVFRRAELASAQFLSVREAQCQWAAALTIEDQFADRYFAFHHLTEHAGIGWQAAGSFIGPDHVLPGKPDPSLSLDALCAEGVFFAGGRLQDHAGAVTRVELAWDDGQTLTDTVESGVALFLGNRDSLDPAIVRFYHAAGSCIAHHRALIDEL